MSIAADLMRVVVWEVGEDWRRGIQATGQFIPLHQPSAYSNREILPWLWNLG